MGKMTLPGLPNYVDSASCVPFELAPDGRALVCRGRKVPVVDGIPRFTDSNNYAASFGEQWKRFATTQLDSRTGVPISEGRLFRAVQEEPSWLRGKLVLEAGCGAGRFTEILLKYGATVDSVDISSAVETNQRNCPLGPRHRVTQADIAALPLPTETYDLVMCLGVVQHTPDSKRTISTLVEYVRPGGILVFDHYLAGWLRGPNRRFGIRLLRPVVLGLPVEDRMPFIEELVKRLYPLHKFLGRSRLASHLLRTFSPVVTYHDSLPLTEAQHLEWSLLDTHDSLTDSYKATLSLTEARQMLVALGLTDSHCHAGDNGVVCKCRIS
jgi:SAM-dependent methyltransferase